MVGSFQAADSVVYMCRVDQACQAFLDLRFGADVGILVLVEASDVAPLMEASRNLQRLSLKPVRMRLYSLPCFSLINSFSFSSISHVGISGAGHADLQAVDWISCSFCHGFFHHVV